MFVPPSVSYFYLFGFPVYYYGIILAFAIFVGGVISNKIAVKEYYLVNIIPNIAASVVICGILGARIYYCLLNFGGYISNPFSIFALREGGLSIHGALIGGAIALYYHAKKNNIEFLKLCDILSIGLPVAQAIGRWGNFCNSEAFGLPTTLPWKMYISQPLRPEKYFYNDYFHPTFLYESLLDIFIFVILYRYVMPRNKDKSGVIAAYYLLLYSVVRFFIEGLRVDCVRYVFNIPFPQFVSIIIILFSLGFIVKSNRSF